jgi:hypothetical protein
MIAVTWSTRGWRPFGAGRRPLRPYIWSILSILPRRAPTRPADATVLEAIHKEGLCRVFVLQRHTEKRQHEMTRVVLLRASTTSISAEPSSGRSCPGQKRYQLLSLPFQVMLYLWRHSFVCSRTRRSRSIVLFLYHRGA